MAHWTAMVPSRTVIPAVFVCRGIPYRGQMIQHRKDYGSAACASLPAIRLKLAEFTPALNAALLISIFFRKV